MFSSSFFSESQQQQQTTAASSACTSSISSHSIQPAVLAMCQALIPTTSSSSSSDVNNEWFYKLINQPQSVIVAPLPRLQTSTISSRRAVRIQIINKHDEITLPPPSLLSMTPSPLSSTSSSMPIDDSTPTLVEYLTNNSTNFTMQSTQQGFSSIIDEIVGKFLVLFSHSVSNFLILEYEMLQDTSNHHLMDLDQPYDGNGWIDTPLSNFGTNSADPNATSSYSTYDFLCL